MSQPAAASLRQAFAAVSCPVCGQSVEAAAINAHLDSACRKHGLKRPSSTDGGSSSSPSSKRRHLPAPHSPQSFPQRTSTLSDTTAAETSTAAPAPAAPAARTFPMFAARGSAAGGAAQAAERRKTAAELAAEAELSKCLAPEPLLSLPRARVYALTSCAKSWLLHVPRWCTMASDGFDALWQRHPEDKATVVLFGQKCECSRWNKMYGQDYVFSGQRSASAGALSAEGCGPELMAAFERVCSLRQPGASAPPQPNGVLVNWYADGSHYIGAHSDDETQLAEGAPIFSVTWGATRKFRLLPRKPSARKQQQQRTTAATGGFSTAAAATSEKLTLEVEDGDLIVMGGRCQKTHKHEVPKTSQLVGRRINATFRTFAKTIQADRVDGSYP